MAVRKIETELSLTGEKQFNDQMKAVNSNLKTLKSEMALVASEFDGQANSIDALRSKQKVLTDQYDQQREKVRALESQLEKAREAYGDNSAQVDKYQQQLNNAKVQLNKFGNELEDTNRYLKEAEESADGAAHSIDEFGKEVKESARDIDSAESGGGGVKGLLGTLGEMKGLLVGGAVVGALKEVGEAVLDITRAGAEYADEVLTMSSVTGLSTETLQELIFMEGRLDVSVETTSGALRKLTQNMAKARDGTGAQAEAFEKLGVQVVDADGNLRGAWEVFNEVIDALGKMTNETERDATAMDLMGKSAQDLNPLIEGGSKALEELKNMAHETDYVMTEEMLNTLGEVQNKFDDLDKKIEGSKNRLAVEFAPAVIAVCDDLIAAWDKVTNAVITAWNWLNKPIGNKTPSTQPGNYSNVTGKYYDPDEEYYGMSNSYLDAIKNGKKHAGGLSYVPYDGYAAILHKGERVLTAGQAAVSAPAVSNSGTGGGTQVIELHTTMQLDKRTIGEAVTEYQVGEERKRG